MRVTQPYVAYAAYPLNRLEEKREIAAEDAGEIYDTIRVESGPPPGYSQNTTPSSSKRRRSLRGRKGFK